MDDRPHPPAGSPTPDVPDVPDVPGVPDRATTAARAAVIVAYAVALVGAGGATLSLREGDLVAALIVLTTTLGVSALLAATGTLLRGLRDVERRLRRLEDAVGSAAR